MSKQSGNMSASNGQPSADHSYFEQQRDLIIREIGGSMEHVLQNLNKLNRSLEGIISVGNEFSSVEALWSHFENVMAKSPEESKPGESEEKEQTLQDSAKR